MPAHVLSLASTSALVLQWLVLHWSGFHPPIVLEALSSGAAIFGAAFLLSWAAELLQLDVSRGLAIAALAVIAVLPEYAVDLYLAWQGGKDPAYVAYATANMTGANRLLIGVGWASLVFILWIRSRGARKQIELAPGQSVELFFLLLATAYAFVIPLKGTLSLLDSVVLLTIFALYVVMLVRQPVEDAHLMGPPVLIASLGKQKRRIITAALFVYSAVGILAAAEPFAESLITTGKAFGVPEYLLIQWLAPLASEAPEFIVAILFVLRGMATAGLGILLSSKVNQWTLLIGALPIAYGASVGGVEAMPLNDIQVKEIFLTAAQSAFALAVLASFTLNLREAALLFGLFAAQVLTHVPELISSPSDRLDAAGYVFGALYIVLALGWLLVNRESRLGSVRLLSAFGRARG